MEQTKLALCAVMIVAVGLIGTNFVTGLDMTEEEKFDALSNPNDIYGHITILHSDPDGNILNYIQTDNTVAAIGKDCMAELVFGEHGATCTATRANFTTIALYNGDSFPNSMNTTGSPSVLDNVLTAAGLTLRNGGQGVVVTENAAATTGGSPVGSKTDIAKTFTAGVGVAGQVVDGATLLNNGTGLTPGENPTSVLAGQTFTPVTLNESDTLLITWTITLG